MPKRIDERTRAEIIDNFAASGLKREAWISSKTHNVHGIAKSTLDRIRMIQSKKRKQRKPSAVIPRADHTRDIAVLAQMNATPHAPAHEATPDERLAVILGGTIAEIIRRLR